jgi:hypothetical protein
MATLKYPETIESSTGDFVKFRFGKYQPPYSGAAPTTPQQTTSYNSEPSFSAGQGAVSDTIYLPMPSDIGSNVTGNWGGKDITALASFALSKAASPVTNFVTGQGTAAATSLGNIFTGDTLTKAAGALGEDLLKELGNTLANLPGMGANLTTNDILSLTSGTIINPNTELLYGGTGLRQHGYTFKIVPANATEASNMIKIVDSFKKAAAPKKNPQKIAGTSVTNFVGVPDIVEVTFLTYDGTTLKESPYLPKYKLSALNSVSVDYVTEGNYASYRDGYPIGVSLTIALTELKLLYSDDIGKYR